MNTISELRDFADMPDDPEATKERIVMFFCSMALGVVMGVIGVMGYFAIVGKPCSAAPYCNEHKAK